MRNKIAITIIALVILATIGVVAYNIKEGNFSKDKSKTETKENKKEEPELTTIDLSEYDTKELIEDDDLKTKLSTKHNQLDSFIVIGSIGLDHFDELNKYEAIIEYAFNTCNITFYNEREFSDATDFDWQGKTSGKIEVISKEQIKDIWQSIYGTEPILTGESTFAAKPYQYIVSDDNKYVIRYLTKENEEYAKKDFPVVNKTNYVYTEDADYYYIYYNYSISVGDYVFYNYEDYTLNSSNNLKKQEERKDIEMDKHLDKFPIIKEYYKKDGSDFFFEKAEYLRK